MPAHKPKRVPRRRLPRATAIVKAAPPTVSEAIEKVLIHGDLSPLTPEQRLEYYNAVCRSLGLNPLTHPFAYLAFRATDTAPAKLVLYALKDCTEQLRKIHGISVSQLRTRTEGDLLIVTVEVKDKYGRTDAATGVVSLAGSAGKSLVMANLIMKAETKAKRRATLSICGLGMLDESELDTVENGVSGSREAQQAVAERIITEHKAKQLTEDEVKRRPVIPEAVELNRVMREGLYKTYAAMQNESDHEIAEGLAKGRLIRCAFCGKNRDAREPQCTNTTCASRAGATPENTVYAHFHQRQQGVVYLWGALKSIEEHIKNDFLGVKQEVSGYWTIPSDKVPMLKELCGYRHLFWKESDTLPKIWPSAQPSKQAESETPSVKTLF